MILVHGSDGVFYMQLWKQPYIPLEGSLANLWESSGGIARAKHFKGVYDTTLEFLEALGGGGRKGE